MQRLPKLRGFNSHRATIETVYTGQLNAFGVKTVDNAALAQAGLVSSQYCKVKLIVNGEVTVKATVKLQAATVGAAEAVKKAGGSFEKVAQVARPKTAKAKADKK